MLRQSSSSEDGSLNIAFFSVLTVSLLLLFVFTDGEAVLEEGEKEMAVLSSVEEDLKKNLKTDDIALYNQNSLLVDSVPFYRNPSVLALKKEEDTKEEEVEEKAPQKEEKEVVLEKRWVELTAYAPLDPGAIEGMCFSGNPRVTASGTTTREGIVATNMFEFGTRIRIPSIYGERVFTVEDRMSPRYTNTVDIFVPTRSEAVSFGTQRAYVEVLK